MEKQAENKMILKIAKTSQINQILELYKLVIERCIKNFCKSWLEYRYIS